MSTSRMHHSGELTKCRLYISAGIKRRLAHFVKQSLPLEVCGYLAGLGQRVFTIIPVPNIAARPAYEFQMEPQAQLNALIAVQKYGLQIIAVYHSHPPGASTVPSLRDIAGQSDPKCIHVIVTPASDLKSQTLRAFEVIDNKTIEIPIPNRELVM